MGLESDLPPGGEDDLLQTDTSQFKKERHAMPTNIMIFDTTLRDGEQVPGAKLNPQQKLEIAHQLARLGVDIIEAGFPASSPGDKAAVAQIAKEVRGCTVAGLARIIKQDIDDVWDAVQFAERPRIHVFLGSSDIHLQSKLRMDREKGIEMAVEAVRYSRNLCPDVEYSTEDASRSDFEYMCRVIEAVIEAGAAVVNIPDTVGYAFPDQFGDMIRRIRSTVPNIDKVILSVHCHNDLGLGTANTLAAIQNGARQVEVTVNGIGERAGNTAMEEIVMALRTRRDIFDATTRIQTKEIFKTSRMISRLMNIPVQPNKAIVGSNAFAHSSGIHQDGILKDRATYEIMRPEDVGIKEHAFVLTARSGRHAVRHHLEQKGYHLAEPLFEKVFTRFLDVADRKKEISDDDLESIVDIEISKAPEVYRFVKLQVISGSGVTPISAVTLQKNGETLTDSASGNGPVDATFNCIDRITGFKCTLLEFDLRAVTKGKDAIGEAMVRVEHNGKTITGRGASPDVIDASARAYLNAINRSFVNNMH